MNDGRDRIIKCLADILWKRSQARGCLKCDCGCDHFFLYKRKKTVEERSEEERASMKLRSDYWPFGPVIARDKDGVPIVRKEFLWLKWKVRPLSDYAPAVLSFQYVAAKCEKCGKEIVLFDGRQYAALPDGTQTKYGELGAVRWDKKPSAVECILDFDEGEGATSEFDRIRVYKVAGGKKSLFFDHET